MEHVQNGQFHLEYPVFAGNRSEELNRLVREYALGLGIGGSIVNNSYEADYLCEVTLVNDSIVSMVFCGTGYVPGAAHDFRDVIPLNVEIRTMQPILSVSSPCSLSSFRSFSGLPKSWRAFCAVLPFLIQTGNNCITKKAGTASISGLFPK